MKLYSLGRAIALAVISLAISAASFAVDQIAAPTAAFANRAFVYPTLSVLAWLFVGYQPDAEASLAVDAMVREARSTDTMMLVKAKAFIDRAMRHMRFSAGGFALDSRLSPA